MRPAKLAAAAAAAVAILVPGLAIAAGNRVPFSGCPIPGVEHGCVLVRSGGQTYNVTSARPPIRFRGLGVAGTGVPGGVSYCLQGVVLTDIKYAYTRLRCPLRPAPLGK